MEWTFAPLAQKGSTVNKDNTIETGESVYSIINHGDQKYLIYIANVTDEKCDTISDIKELVDEEILVENLINN